MLQDIGALPQDATDAQYELRMPAAEPRTVSLAPEELTHGGLMAKYPDLVSGADLAPSPRPLYLSDTDTPLWMRHLEAPSAVYFCFQQVNDNPEQPFAQFIAELMRTVEETSAEHLIIDMRRNGGGNTGLVMPLIHALIRNERINQPGRLFVIIGRNTFSAAQNTANMIEIHTSATFVGEPTGSRPTFVGESTSFVLPYSKLRVYCSSRYWQFLTSTDRRTWIQPQIAAEVSSRDYFENRDPCMDAILARITKAPQAD
jgi:hypothetical protein